MANNKRTRRSKAKRRRRRSKLANVQVDSMSLPTVDQASRTIKEAPSVLTNAIRIAGLAPIALLVAYFALHDSLPGRVPSWLQPVVDKEVAVLTLSAGHAGIIGLLISTKGRFGWGTYALFIAATATALAGVRTLGESAPGQAVAVMLMLLTIPAVWAEKLSANLNKAWNFARSWSGFSAISLIAALIGIAYNQARDENYIKNWILIPIGILLGIAATVLVLWLLIRIGHKVVPMLLSRLGAIVAAANRWLTRRCPI